MKKNKHAMRFSKKSLLIMVSVIAVFAMSIGGVMAWLVASTDKLENKFAMGSGDIEIEENFHDNIKEDVGIRNIGDVPVYVRANVVYTWMKGEAAVAKPSTAVITKKPDTPGGKWFEGSDGFFYYKDKVQPGDTTANLYDSIEATGLPEGYSLHVEVMGQSIQTEPVSAVNTWPVTINTDGTLAAAR